MVNIQEGTEESVLIVALYLAISGEIFLPLVISNKWRNPCWRIPGGGTDLGETSTKAAYRELYEETGLKAKELHHTATISKKSWGFTNGSHRQFVYVTHVDDISTLLESSLDGDEKLTVKLFEIREVTEYLKNNQNKLDGHQVLKIHETILESVLRKLDFL